MSKLKEFLRETRADDTVSIRKNQDVFSVLDTLEAIDDDDASLILDANITDRICRSEDDGLSSFDPPCRIAEEIVGYSPDDNISFEATAQDFNEIENNCEANADTDEQIKSIIEAMKMDW